MSIKNTSEARQETNLHSRLSQEDHIKEIRSRVRELPNDELKLALLTVLDRRTDRGANLLDVKWSLNVCDSLAKLNISLQPSQSESEIANNNAIEAAEIVLSYSQQTLSTLKKERELLKKYREKHIADTINDMIKELNKSDPFPLIDRAIISELAKKVYTHDIQSYQKAAELYIEAVNKSMEKPDRESFTDLTHPQPSPF